MYNFSLNFSDNMYNGSHDPLPKTMHLFHGTLKNLAIEAIEDAMATKKINSVEEFKIWLDLNT